MLTPAAACNLAAIGSKHAPNNKNKNGKEKSNTKKPLATPETVFDIMSRQLPDSFSENPQDISLFKFQ